MNRPHASGARIEYAWSDHWVREQRRIFAREIARTLGKAGVAVGSRDLMTEIDDADLHVHYDDYVIVRWGLMPVVLSRVEVDAKVGGDECRWVIERRLPYNGFSAFIEPVWRQKACRASGS